MRTYVICAEPRSGSNLLAEALRDTSVAGNPDEWYDLPFLHDRLSGFGLAAPTSTRAVPVPVSGREYLRALLAETSADRYFGIKIHWHQYQLAMLAGLGDLFETLTDLATGPLVILLIRKDRIQQAVSTYIAACTGRYFAREGLPPAPRTQLPRRYWRGLDCAGPELTDDPVPFDFAEIDAIVTQIEADERAWRDLIATRRLPACELSYEELTSDRDSSLRRVFDFLGLAVREVPEPTFLRQATVLNDQFVAAYSREKREVRDPEAGKSGGARS